MTEDRPYHHGNLRRALLEAAVAAIAEDGPSHVSLREVARRAGVSHAAPRHHFGDKAGVLTAVAVEGYGLLADALQQALAADTVDLTELGVRYVQFAAEHQAHFEVMFRPELYHAEDPAVLAARARTGQLLQVGLRDVVSSGRGDPDTAGLAAWLLAHGFATLWRTGALDRQLAETEPADLFRAAAGQLFAGPRPARSLGVK